MSPAASVTAGTSRSSRASSDRSGRSGRLPLHGITPGCAAAVVVVLSRLPAATCGVGCAVLVTPTCDAGRPEHVSRASVFFGVGRRPWRRRARRGRSARPRSAVDREMSRHSAACSRVRPPKKRSSTSLALSGSWAANCSRASCRARRSSARAAGVEGVEVGVLAPPAAAALLAALAAGVLDQDAAHGLGGGGEEVAAVGEGLVRVGRQAQVGLVDQGGGVERLARLLAGHLRAPPAGAARRRRAARAARRRAGRPARWR